MYRYSWIMNFVLYMSKTIYYAFAIILLLELIIAQSLDYKTNLKSFQLSVKIWCLLQVSSAFITCAFPPINFLSIILDL